MAIRRWLSGLLLVSCSLLLHTLPAMADDMLSCQDRLVSVGDPPYRVQTLCGVPDWVEHRTEVRTVRRPGMVPCRVGNGIGQCSGAIDDSVEVHIEVWTYDFGPYRFVEYLTFEQGKLTNVQAGGYGVKKI